MVLSFQTLCRAGTEVGSEHQVIQGFKLYTIPDVLACICQPVQMALAMFQQCM